MFNIFVLFYAFKLSFDAIDICCLDKSITMISLPQTCQSVVVHKEIKSFAVDGY